MTRTAFITAPAHEGIRTSQEYKFIIIIRFAQGLQIQKKILFFTGQYLGIRAEKPILSALITQPCSNPLQSSCHSQHILCCRILLPCRSQRTSLSHSFRSTLLQQQTHTLT